MNVARTSHWRGCSRSLRERLEMVRHRDCAQPYKPRGPKKNTGRRAPLLNERAQQAALPRAECRGGSRTHRSLPAAKAQAHNRRLLRLSAHAGPSSSLNGSTRFKVEVEVVCRLESVCGVPYLRIPPGARRFFLMHSRSAAACSHHRRPLRVDQGCALWQE